MDCWWVQREPSTVATEKWKNLGKKGRLFQASGNKTLLSHISPITLALGKIIFNRVRLYIKLCLLQNIHNYLIFCNYSALIKGAPADNHL